MNDVRPLLAFPPPTIGPVPPRPGFPRRPTGPGPRRQGERLAPRFVELEAAFASARVEPDGPEGGAVDPELVIVFELAGSVAVAEFARAMTQVGLEFLVELLDDEAQASDEFAVVDAAHGTSKPANAYLYAAFSDAEAAKELVRLFTAYSVRPNSFEFPRGLAPLRGAFNQLDDLRLWDAQDRVRETGLLNYWEEDVDAADASPARVEVELWYRAGPTARAEADRGVRQAVAAAGGTVIAVSQRASINYHGMLVDIPHREVQRVLDEGPEAIDLFLAPHVMLVSSVSRSGLMPARDGADGTEVADRPLPDAVPAVVALLDGVPMANHSLLAGRLVIDDPQGLGETYTSALNREHGTQMASLLCHGDLLDGEPPLLSPVYVHPILQQRPELLTW